MFKIFRKVIAVTLIFALIVTSNATAFAQFLQDESNVNIYNLPTYKQYKGEVSETVKPKVEEQAGINPYIEEVIAEKYKELLGKFGNKKADLDARLRSFDIEGYGADNNPRVNSTIVQPASVNNARYRSQSQTKMQVDSQQKILNKMQQDQNGYGRMLAISNLLNGDEEEQAMLEAMGELPQGEAEQESSPEMTAFEEEYVHYLLTELIKAAKGEFILHSYKLIPYVREKKDPKWNAIKKAMKSGSNAYLKYLKTVNKLSTWMGESDRLIKMLPYIKSISVEENYIGALNTAHAQLSEAMRQCIDRNKCDDYFNLLAKEVFFYFPGSEKNYTTEIKDGYDHGVRGALLDLGKRKRNYGDYNNLLLTALTNYLELKQYDIISDIIETQEWAEEQLKLQPPVNALDMMSFTTYVKAGLTLNVCRDVLTYYPDIPELPSRKGQYVGENNTQENIWWDLGEMLREDGSNEAQAVLEKQINKIKKRFDVTRGEDVLNLGQLGILKISALVNIKKNIAGAEEKARGVMNTSYGDLTFDEEKAIDMALSKRYPKLKAEKSLGAVITAAGEKHKRENVEIIDRWNNYGEKADVIMIFVGLGVGIAKAAIKGIRLGVGLLRSVKAARLAPKSAKRIAYVRKNIKSIQYYKAWNASRKSAKVGTGGSSLVPSNGKPASTPQKVTGPQVQPNTSQSPRTVTLQPETYTEPGGTAFRPAASARPEGVGGGVGPKRTVVGDPTPGSPSGTVGKTPTSTVKSPTTGKGTPATTPTSTPNKTPNVTALSPDDVEVTAKFDDAVKPQKRISVGFKPEEVPVGQTENNPIGFRVGETTGGTPSPSKNNPIGFRVGETTGGTPSPSKNNPIGFRRGETTGGAPSPSENNPIGFRRGETTGGTPSPSENNPIGFRRGETTGGTPSPSKNNPIGFRKGSDTPVDQSAFVPDNAGKPGSGNGGVQDFTAQGNNNLPGQRTMDGPRALRQGGGETTGMKKPNIVDSAGGVPSSTSSMPSTPNNPRTSNINLRNHWTSPETTAQETLDAFDDEIARLQQKRKKLGLFAREEKAAIDKEIASLEAQRSNFYQNVTSKPFNSHSPIYDNVVSPKKASVESYLRSTRVSGDGAIKARDKYIDLYNRYLSVNVDALPPAQRAEFVNRFNELSELKFTDALSSGSQKIIYQQKFDALNNFVNGLGSKGYHIKFGGYGLGQAPGGGGTGLTEFRLGAKGTTDSSLTLQAFKAQVDNLAGPAGFKDPPLVDISAHGYLYGTPQKGGMSWHGTFGSGGDNTMLEIVDVFNDGQQYNLYLRNCHAGAAMDDFLSIPINKRGNINMFTEAGRNQSNFAILRGRLPGNAGNSMDAAIDNIVESLSRGNIGSRAVINGQVSYPLDAAIAQATKEGNSALVKKLNVYKTLLDTKDISEFERAASQYSKLFPGTPAPKSSPVGFTIATNQSDIIPGKVLYVDPETVSYVQKVGKSMFNPLKGRPKPALPKVTNPSLITLPEPGVTTTTTTPRRVLTI